MTSWQFPIGLASCLLALACGSKATTATASKDATTAANDVSAATDAGKSADAAPDASDGAAPDTAGTAPDVGTGQDSAAADVADTASDAGVDAGPACVVTGPELPDDGIDNDCQAGDLKAAAGKGVYVSQTNGDDNNPGTMDKPLQSVQKGADTAGKGGRVFIAGATYGEGVTTAADLFGGYEFGKWTRDLKANVTTLNNTAGPAVITAEDATVTVDGLALIGAGQAPGMGNTSAGMMVKGGVNLSRCTVTNQGVANSVIGFLALGAMPIYIADSTITAGSSLFSSLGASTGSGPALIVRSRIASGTINPLKPNLPQSSWNTKALTAADAVLINSTFTTPGAPANAGSANVLGSSGKLEIYHCFLSAGDAPKGSHVAIQEAGELALVNSVLHVGVAAEGAQPFLSAVYKHIVHNNIPTFADVATWNACAGTTCVSGSGNTSVDDTYAGGKLDAASVLIDAGVNPADFGHAVTTDFEGDPRPHGKSWDLGPDEFE